MRRKYYSYLMMMTSNYSTDVLLYLYLKNTPQSSGSRWNVRKIILKWIKNACKTSEFHSTEELKAMRKFHIEIYSSQKAPHSVMRCTVAPGKAVPRQVCKINKKYLALKVVHRVCCSIYLLFRKISSDVRTLDFIWNVSKQYKLNCTNKIFISNVWIR